MTSPGSRLALWSVLAAAAVACSGSSPRPVDPPASRPPPEDPMVVALRAGAVDADRLCRCDTAACVDQVEGERDHAVDGVGQDPAATPEQRAEAERLAGQRDECRTRIGEAEMERRLEPLAPDCVEYLHVAERLGYCDQMAVAAESLAQATNDMRASFQQMLDLDPEAQAAAFEAAGPACRQAVEALREAATAMGCI